MSFGVFESVVGLEAKAGFSRQASVDKLNAAVYDVREKLGGFLFQASSVEEFRDRVAMTKNDQSLFKIIEAAGLHPATGIVRRIAGKNSILEEEFKTKLAEHSITNPETGDTLHYNNPHTKKLQDRLKGGEPIEGIEAKEARRRRADFEGVQDIDSTFSHTEQGKELKPKDDWEGYKNKVDQNAPSKVKRNFASKLDWNVYLAWCQSNNRSAARLSSLDAYASNLSDDKYLRLANTIAACDEKGWDSDHKPKVPNTKLKKNDKVAAGEYADQRAHDVAWMTAEERNQHEVAPSAADLQEKQKHTALHHYIAWCDRNGYSKVAKSTIDYYVSRVAGEHSIDESQGNPTRYNDPSRHPDFYPQAVTDETGARRNPPLADQGGKHRAALRKHLYSQVATTIRWAKTAANKSVFDNPEVGDHIIADQGYAPITDIRSHAPGSHPDSPIHDHMHAVEYVTPRGSRWKGEGQTPPGYKSSRRRTAAPDYLQKADDALTQLLNQKAQEFQETIAPLQQALQTVQQAEQLQQQQNPLNVLPPAGTVNVLPGGGQPSTADQVGMPDPNAQDTSGLAALLSGAGGTAPNDAPVGGGQDAPPPAAAGQGALPPDPSQQQQIAASRRKQAGPKVRGPIHEMEGGYIDRGGQAYRGKPPLPQEISIKETKKGWHDAGGGFHPHEATYRSAGNPHAVGSPAWFRHEEGEGDPASYGPKGSGAPGGGIPLRGPLSPEQEAWMKKRGRQAAGVGELFDNWRQKKTQGGDLLRGGDADYDQFANEHGVGDRALTKLKNRNQTPDFAPINGVTVGKRSMPRRANRKKAEGTARSRRQAEQLTGPFAGYSDFQNCKDENSDKGDSAAYCGEIHNKVTKGRERKGEPLHDHQDKQSRRKRSNPSALDTGRHSIDDPDNEHSVIMDPTSPYTGGPLMQDTTQDLTPKAARRKRAYNPIRPEYVHDSQGNLRQDKPHDIGVDGPYADNNEPFDAEVEQRHYDEKKRRTQGRRKQAWSGFGPALFPKTRKVAGWDWDDGLQAYIANAPRKFACSCGTEHDTPSGYQRCKCGKAYNSYVIGTGGNNREAAAEKFLVREIAVRPDVIVASRKKRRSSVQLVDPRTGNIHRLIDPGELDDGEDPGHSTFRKPPADWARRGDGAKWVKNPIGR